VFRYLFFVPFFCWDLVLLPQEVRITMICMILTAEFAGRVQKLVADVRGIPCIFLNSYLGTRDLCNFIFLQRCASYTKEKNVQ